jgi:hypothetical protein
MPFLHRTDPRDLPFAAEDARIVDDAQVAHCGSCCGGFSVGSNRNELRDILEKQIHEGWGVVEVQKDTKTSSDVQGAKEGADCRKSNNCLASDITSPPMQTRERRHRTERETALGEPIARC